MKIKVRVRPNSQKREITIDKGNYKVYLKSPPEKNKANAELVGLLKRHFNKPVRIISGASSRNKIIEIEK